ncbi:MAG: hypothetical protein QM760_03710 [Nibricoccus sp.]
MNMFQDVLKSLRIMGALTAVSLLLLLVQGSLTAVSSAAAAGDTADGETVARPRETILAWVDGSTEENTIWRGWPAIVSVDVLSGTASAEVQLRGSAPIEMKRAGPAWIISAETSAKLEKGVYSLTAGGQTVAVTVADAPPQLSPEQQSARWNLLVQSALLSGDFPRAKEAANAWTQAMPGSPLAQEARGDALRKSGDPKGAFAAYDQALKLTSPRLDPPPASLHQKINGLLNESARAAKKRVSADPTPDDVNYFLLIDAGDKALAAKDRAAAIKSYDEAAAFYQQRSLKVSTIELDDKRAALGLANAGAKTSPATSTAAPATSVTSSTAVSAPSAAAAGPGLGAVVSADELVEAKILADPAGQWAADAKAGSQYGSGSYAAAKMVGAPDVPKAGDNGNAWCHHSSSKGVEWIELTYGKPVHAVEVRVRQNNAPGAIVKVEAIEPNGTAHVWWEGVDPFKAPAQATLAWFAIRVPRTDYLVAKMKITLNLAAVPGWKEIDAVQLVGRE